jgi:hypothetical protein
VRDVRGYLFPLGIEKFASNARHIAVSSGSRVTDLPAYILKEMLSVSGIGSSPGHAVAALKRHH